MLSRERFRESAENTFHKKQTVAGQCTGCVHLETMELTAGPGETLIELKNINLNHLHDCNSRCISCSSQRGSLKRNKKYSVVRQINCQVVHALPQYVIKVRAACCGIPPPKPSFSLDTTPSGAAC